MPCSEPCTNTLLDHHPASPKSESPVLVGRGHVPTAPAGVGHLGVQLSHRRLPTSPSVFNSALYLGLWRFLVPPRLSLSEDLKLFYVLMPHPYEQTGFNLSGFLSQSPLTTCFPASRMWLTPLIGCYLLIRSLCPSG